VAFGTQHRQRRALADRPASDDRRRNGAVRVEAQAVGLLLRAGIRIVPAQLVADTDLQQRLMHCHAGRARRVVQDVNGAILLWSAATTPC